MWHAGVAGRCFELHRVHIDSNALSPASNVRITSLLYAAAAEHGFSLSSVSDSSARTAAHTLEIFITETNRLREYPPRCSSTIIAVITAPDGTPGAHFFVHTDSEHGFSSTKKLYRSALELFALLDRKIPQPRKRSTDLSEGTVR